MGWAVSTVGGLGAAALVLLLYRRERRPLLDHRHAAAGAIAAGLAVFSLVAEALVLAWREWWTQHPIAGAFLTAVLALVLTLVFLERVLEARHARDMRRLFNGPASDFMVSAIVGDLSTSRAHLERVRGPFEVNGDPDVRWAQQPDLQRGLAALLSAAGSMRDSAADLRHDLLAGGVQMHTLYRELFEVSRATRAVDQAVSILRAEHHPLDDEALALGVPDDDPRVRYLSDLWANVCRSYDRLCTVMVDVDVAVANLAALDQSASEPRLRLVAPDPLSCDSQGLPDPPARTP